MTKTIKIGDKTCTMKASALVPRLYRIHFGRDLIADMAKLKKAYEKANAEDIEDAFSAMDLEIFENLAWIMLRHSAELREVARQTPDGSAVTRKEYVNGDFIVGNSPDDWLDNMDGVFSIYEVLPEILDLWVTTQATTSVPAKK